MIDPASFFLPIREAQIQLLERLSNAAAVSGDEREVRAIVQEEIQPFVDEVRVDALGNVLAVRRSNAANPLRVMLAAHMDEVGFIIVEEEDGWLRFETVGGIDPRVLVGKPVLVGKERLPGVIGARPIHLTSADERKNALPVENLRIDLGPENGKKVKPGERAVFATRFRQSGASLVGKALDDRLGVATLIELLKNPPANVELLAAFTVQEEVGLRGARVAAYTLNPDLAIAVDATPANDLPHWDGEENTRYNTRSGAGAAIYVADAGTLSDPRLIRHLIRTAEQHGIPYQVRQPGGGGTDAGAIHKQRAGIPSVSVSVPVRYAHTPVLQARLLDWENTLALLYHGLDQLSPELFAENR
ncbi:MAG: M42 family metallopeptidase [Bellilinea sp.]|jgi:endoglucanase